MKIPKSSKAIIFTTVIFIAAAYSLCCSPAAETQIPRQHRFEYATIRWSGRDNTHIIRPNGEVEFVGSKLDKIAKPNRADDRSFYMNIVMNGLAKEGYEFSGISNDEVVMKREAGDAK